LALIYSASQDFKYGNIIYNNDTTEWWW